MADGHKTIWLTVLLCLLWLAQTSYALASGKPLSQYKRISWNTENGLPQNLVMSMLQTRDGYLWFGTQEGLARFNGISFKTFDATTAPELKSGFVSSLIEDRAGNLWVGTAKGLYRYQNGKFIALMPADNAQFEFVTVVFEDRNGIVWVGTGGGILAFQDDKLISTYTTEQGLSNNRVRSIGEDPNGNLWIATASGLNRLRDNRFDVFTVSDGLADNNVRTIQSDALNNFWIGTETGVSLFQDGRFVSDERFKGKKILSIKRGKNDYLWFCGEFGVSRMKNNEIETLERGNGVFSSGVYRVFEDNEGSIWMATEGEGLKQFIDTKFIAYTTADGMLSDSVYSIDQSGDGGIWIGSEKGLNLFWQNSFDFGLTEGKGLPNTRVTATLETEKGGLLIGTNSGLLTWKKGQDKPVNVEGSNPQTAIRALYRDSDNQIWIGATKGFFGFDSDNKKIVNFAQFEPLKEMTVQVVSGSLSKGLWIGTLRGLYHFKDNNLTHYTTKDGLALNSVISFYEDSSGALWIGTFGGGLSRFKDGKFTTMTTQNGLFNSLIYKILPDDDGNLWMSCNRGIFRVEKQSLDDFMDGRREAVQSFVYGIADGMNSFECNGGFQSSGLKARDGKLWFPTIRGVVVIDPKNMPLNRQPPPVRLENLLADLQPITVEGKPILAAGTNRLVFQYAALSFIAPEKVKFRYQLEGYDAEWMEVGNKHEANYTNLPHGEYTFHVVAASNDGAWNEIGDSFTFSIKPFYYQTWWFKLLAALLVAGLIGAIYLWQVKLLQMRHAAVLNERTRIARELHDTLLQGFVGVSSQLSVVAAQFQDAPEIAERHLDVARKMIRHSVTEARRSVQNLRDDGPDEADFGQSLQAAVSRLTEGETLNSTVSVTGKPFKLPPQYSQNLLRILEEALTNAVKHGGAKTVKIAFAYDSPKVRLEVADDGRGFDVKTSFSILNGHFGLIGMKERAALTGGEISVESYVGSGTKIVFEGSPADSAEKQGKINSLFGKKLPKNRD